MSEKQHIVISAFRDGKSLRAISKETGINRRTVTKYVRDYEERRNQLLQADNNIDVKELTDYIVEKPKYNSAN
ncbi:helix-turn-helix domain-containing protein, partial [Desulfofalx alkaliphila]